MRRTPIASVILLALLITFVAVSGDEPDKLEKKKPKLVVITLNVGGEVTGVILEHDGKKIVVETMGGIVVIDRDEVDSIDDGEPSELYKKLLKKTDLSRASNQYRLAMWCKRFHKQEYERHLKKCLEIQPEHIAAQEELGLYKWEDKWLPYEEYQKARGFVKYKDRYYPRHVADRLEAGLVLRHGRWVLPGAKKSGKGTSKPGVKKEISVPEDIAGLLETIEKGDHDHRAKACEEIAAKPEGANLLRQELPKLIKQKEESLTGYFKTNAGSIRKELHRKLEPARKHARAAIFSKTIYPDANHGKAGQPEVDKRVDAVRLLWEQPLSYCLPKREPVKEKWDDLLDLISVAGKYVGVPKATSLKLRLEKECSEIINMRKFCSPKGSFDILSYNKNTKTTLTDDERGVLDLTNEYRMMLGFTPFRNKEALVQAARKHSQCMRDNNFFSHNCKIHGNMAARGRREGTGIAGENIARGSRTSYQAFMGWYNSSGHHRNVLGRFRHLGVGKAGTYWTEDFG
jgi:uncharacterized protein YkwD